MKTDTFYVDKQRKIQKLKNKNTFKCLILLNLELFNKVFDERLYKLIAKEKGTLSS